MSYFDYERTLLGYLEGIKMQLLARPLNLGGVAGSGGGTGGSLGYIGQLPQTKSTYDTDEFATMATPISGASLLDNLNHIRYRIQAVESGTGPGTITIKDDGTTISTGITVIDFIGGTVTLTSPDSVSVMFVGGGGGGSTVNHVYNELVSGTSHFDTSNIFATDTLQVYYNGIRQDEAYFTPDVDRGGFTLVGFTAGAGDEVLVDYDVSASGVVSSGGGHVIQDEGTSLPARTYLNFIGAGVTVTDDSANDRTNVTVTASGGGGVSITWDVADTDTDTAETYTTVLTSQTNAIQEIVLHRPVKVNRFGWRIYASGTYTLAQTMGLTANANHVVDIVSSTALDPGWNYFDLDPEILFMPGTYYFELSTSSVSMYSAGGGTYMASNDLCYFSRRIRGTSTLDTNAAFWPLYIRGKMGTITG